jgi:hypothetical protein
MGKGNRVLRLRVEPELLQEILRQIEQRNQYTSQEPWDMSAFLRAAVREKLAHMQRARKQGKGKARKAPEGGA